MIAFRMHRNGTDQSGFTAGAYNLLLWTSCDYDEGGCVGSFGWTPVAAGCAPRPVAFSGQVWIREGGTGSPPNYVVRIIKNELVTIGAAVGIPGSNFANSAVIPISMQDIAQPGDIYRALLYASNASAIVDGNPLHTFWCGVAV